MVTKCETKLRMLMEKMVCADLIQETWILKFDSKVFFGPLDESVAYESGY